MATKDLLVSIGIGATMQAGARAVFTSAEKYLTGLGATIKTNERRAGRIEGYRTLEGRLGKTRAAAREATERVAKLSAAMRKSATPSKAMGRELGQARRAAAGLAAAVEAQTRALGKQRSVLRRAGEDVRDLARAERGLGKALEDQRRRRDRITASMARQAAARERRGVARGQLVDAVALGYPLARAMKSTIGAAIRFESVMADVRKVVDFDTPGQFQAMGRDVLELSTRLPVAATGLGEIVAAAGQAGIARHELLRFTEDAAKMAVAFDMSAAEAGSAMTGMRAIFGLNQDRVMDLAGAYNHLSNNMDATAADMLRVANRAGPTAREMFRLTGQELGALSATFLALKTPPEVAGTAINAMLTKLATADQQTDGFRDALDEIGLSAEDLREAIERDGAGALLSFLEAVDQAEDKQSVLFNLFGQEYVDDVAKLAGGLDLYRKAIGLSSQAQADASSIQREYAERAATTENNLQLLRNRMERLGVNIGSAFLPTVNALAGAFGAVTDRIAVFAERFPMLTRVMTGAAAGIVGIKVAAIGLGYLKTFGVDTVESVRQVMIRLAPVLHTTREGVRRLGLAALPTRARLRGLGAAIANLGADTVSGARTALLGLADAVRNPRQAVRGLGGALGSLRTAAIPAAIRGLGMLRLALVSTGIGAIVVGIGVAAGLVIKYWEPVGAFFAGMWRGIKSALQPLADAFAWLAPLGEAIGKVFSALFGPIETSSAQMEAFGSTGERVGKIIGTAFRVLATPMSKVVKGVGWVLKKLNVISDDPPDLSAPETPAAPNVLGVKPPPKPSPIRSSATGAVLGVALAGAPAAAGSPPGGVILPPPPEMGAGPVFPAVQAVPVDARQVQSLIGGGAAAPIGGPNPRAVTMNVDVGGIVIQTPPGADAAWIAREIERQLAEIMREAATEAGLAEADGA